MSVGADAAQPRIGDVMVTCPAVCSSPTVDQVPSAMPGLADVSVPRGPLAMVCNAFQVTGL